MPKMILTETEDKNSISWGDVLPPEKKPPHYAGLGRGQGEPFPDVGRIPYRQMSGNIVGRDLINGRFSYDTIISLKMKELIEKWDPVAHHYLPLTITGRDDEVVEDQYFLFRAGDLVEGIIENQSDVVPVIRNGEFRRFDAPAWPKIIWEKDAISGRHWWVAKYLTSFRFCSDEFAKELKRLKIRVFDQFPSFAE